MNVLLLIVKVNLNTKIHDMGAFAIPYLPTGFFPLQSFSKWIAIATVGSANNKMTSF